MTNCLGRGTYAMNHRIRIVSIISLLTFGLLTQYTNCAPVDSASSLGSDQIAEVDGEVRIIDNWNTKPLIFAERAIRVESTASAVNVEGICLKSSAAKKILWAVEDQSGDQTFEEGEAKCDRGSFTIQVAEIDSLPCDQNVKLLARVEGSDQIEELNVDRVCQ